MAERNKLRIATNLKCQNCVNTVKPFFDGNQRIVSWSVDTSAPEKWLTVHGEIAKAEVLNLLEESGFKHVEFETPTSNSEKNWLDTYRPLLLIALFLLVVTAIAETNQGVWIWTRAMRNFMGGFFLAFSFFKFLNVQAFAAAFQGYDVLARRYPGYGFAYPFLEFSLGVAFLLNFWPKATCVVTFLIMTVGLIGVVDVLRQKRQIQCACLGTVFDLPMSVVTFVENGLMATMAVLMLLL